MGHEVYANNMLISAKCADGKSPAAFPDPCMTPPPPPGVPVPYPNTSFSSDLTNGSKTVKIGRTEVALKNKSYYKTSTGNEAGCAPKKGVMSSVIKGKTYFTSWSMNVKIEGLNVVRHMDMATHNHGSTTNTPPWAYLDKQTVPPTSPEECAKKKQEAEDKCKDAKPKTKKNSKGKDVPDGLDCDEDCKKAKACVLKPKENDKAFCCSPETTGHHLVEVHCFSPTGDRGGKLCDDTSGYNMEKAPCVCASGSRSSGSHGVMHAVQQQMEVAYNQAPGALLATWPGKGDLVPGGGGARGDAYSKWNYEQARDVGAKAHKMANPHCDEECIKQQLDDYHLKSKDKGGAGLKKNTPLRSDPSAENRIPKVLNNSQQAEVSKMANAVNGNTATQSTINGV